MICPICKKLLEEGKDFCPDCGCRVVQSEETKKDASLDYKAFVPGPKREKENKNVFSKIKIFAIVLCVFLAIGAFLIFWENLVGFALRTFSDPQGYSDYVEEKAWEENVKSWISFYSEWIDNSKTEGVGITSEMQVNANYEELKKIFPQMAQEEMKDLITWLGSLKITWDADMDSENGKLQYRYAFSTEKAQIAVLKLFYDQASEKIAVSLPGLTEKSFVMPFVDGGSIFSNMETKKYPEPEVLEELLLRYGSILYQSLQNDTMKMEKDAYFYNGGNVSCYTIKTEFTDKDLVELLKKVYEEMKNDSALEDIWDSFFQDGTVETAPSYDEFLEEVEALINLIEEEANGELLFVLTDFVSARNEILGRKIVFGEEDLILSYFSNGEVLDFAFETAEFEVSLSGIKDGKELELELKVESDGVEAVNFTISGEMARKNTQLNGSLKISGNEMLQVGVSVRQISWNFFGTPDVEMEICFKAGEDLVKLADGTEYEEILSDLSLRMSFSTQKNSINTGVSLLSEEEELFGFQMEQRQRELGSIEQPEQEDCVEDMALWAQSLDMEKLLDNVKKSGLKIIEDMLSGIPA